jgi:predicted metal-binding membrane protein
VSAVEALLRRERAVLAAGLAALAALAWLYLWQGAGMGMAASDMTALALFPHRHPEPMAGMGGMPAAWLTAVAMWWTMMVAMMTPSAAPLLLLYGRVLRQHGTAPARPAYIAPFFVAAGYLAAWLGFSVAAASAQQLLTASGFLSGMMLWSKSAALSATVLAAAGIYQLSPLKHACLARCRAPVEFLTRYWRPGRLGALRLGLVHGAWCVGCCWVLMALLFVGGLMNLAWIAVLTLLVLVEKLSPVGPLVGKAAGVLLLAWAAATLLVQ